MEEEKQIELETVGSKEEQIETKKKGNAKKYLTIFFLFGFLCTTVSIVVTQITWDEIAKKIGASGLGYNILVDFTRAAIIEEAFKFLGFYLAYIKFKFTKVKDFIIAAGIVGFVFGLVEKAVLFNIMPLILGVIIPMHVLWQLNRGRHFYNFLEARKEGNKKRAFWQFFMASVVIVLIHGTWDALLDLGEYFANKEEISYLGTIMYAIVIIFGIFYIIYTIRKIIKAIAKAEDRVVEE